MESAISTSAPIAEALALVLTNLCLLLCDRRVEEVAHRSAQMSGDDERPATAKRDRRAHVYTRWRAQKRASGGYFVVTCGGPARTAHRPAAARAPRTTPGTCGQGV
jgi:hypothetical protein